MVIRRYLTAAAVLLLASVSPGLAEASAPLSERYSEAAALARSGNPGKALEILARLADARRDSVPVHRAVALLALEMGREDEWRSTFRKRVRRKSRDVGASVGLAILEEARGRRSEAHRLLMTSLTAESRDPLLAPLLLRTTADRAGFVRWLRQRQAVLPRDPAFAALRSRILFAEGALDEAREVLDKALEREADHPDLLTLRADLLRAGGDTDAACEDARVAAGFMVDRDLVPEVSVPDKLRLARAFTSCGSFDEAAALLDALSSLASIGDDYPLRDSAALVRAELLVARGLPLDALELLESAGIRESALDASLRELGWSIRARALALLGTQGPGLESALVTTELPTGLELGERATALAVLLSVGESPDPRLQARLDEVAEALRARGLERRGARLLALLAVLGHRDLPDAVSLGEGPTERVLLALAGAARADREGRPADLLAEVDRPQVELIGAPGQLSAALREIGARAALRAGRPADAARLAFDGLLDIIEADRTGQALPPDLLAIAGQAADRAVRLAGLRLEARLSQNSEPEQEILDAFVSDLGRAVRGWSLSEATWPGNLEGLAKQVPEGACLIAWSGDPSTRAIAIGGAGSSRVEVLPRGEVEEGAACSRAETILWAGPASPGAGLFAQTPEGRRKVLVRVTSARPVFGVAEEGEGDVERGAVGPGSERPLLSLVREASGADADATEGAGDAPATPGRARAFVGPGLALSRVPLASGFTCASWPASPRGWAGPDTLLSWPALHDGGLMLLGMRTLPDRGEIEKGAWVLAEAGLRNGRSWVLVSRRPLSAEEWGGLARALPDWNADPLEAARRLASADPELASALALWSAPGRLPQESARLRLLPWASALFVVVVALWLALSAWKRRRRAHNS